MLPWLPRRPQLGAALGAQSHSRTRTRTRSLWAALALALPALADSLRARSASTLSGPINLAFHHDPTSKFGKIGSPLLVRSTLAHASSSTRERLQWHVLTDAEHVADAEAFVGQLREEFAGLGARVLVEHITEEFGELQARVKGKNDLCNNAAVLRHHFSLGGNTFPADVDQVLMLDTDMLLQSDVAALWDEMVTGLDERTPLAAHRNCNIKFGDLTTYADSSFAEAYRTLPEDCTYDNGVLLMDLAALRSRSWLNQSVELLRHPGAPASLKFRACTRDLMNMVFAGRIAAMPDKWMVGKACKPSTDITGANLLHFSGGTKAWDRKCNPLVKHLVRELDASSSIRSLLRK